MWPRTATNGSTANHRVSPPQETVGGFVISSHKHGEKLPVYSLYVGSRDGGAFSGSDRQAVIDATSAAFGCFTIVDADGFFQRKSVATLIIKVATDDSASVEALSNGLGHILDQEDVGMEVAGLYRSISTG